MEIYGLTLAPAIQSQEKWIIYGFSLLVRKKCVKTTVELLGAKTLLLPTGAEP